MKAHCIRHHFTSFSLTLLFLLGGTFLWFCKWLHFSSQQPLSNPVSIDTLRSYCCCSGKKSTCIFLFFSFHKFDWLVTSIFNSSFTLLWFLRNSVYLLLRFSISFAPFFLHQRQLEGPKQKVNIKMSLFAAPWQWDILNRQSGTIWEVPWHSFLEKIQVVGKERYIWRETAPALAIVKDERI